MYFFKKKTLPLLSMFALLMLSACSSHNDVVSVSETHLFNEQFGLNENPYVDAVIEQELLAINEPTEVEVPLVTDPTWTTELSMDPDAFLEEEYVPTPEVITYKYNFDPKFYSKAEWRKMP